MNKAINLNLSFDLIQSVRLAHAIMETTYEICIIPQNDEKFSILRQKFGAEYTVTSELPAKLTGIKISHQEPKTSIGSIDRPLIFPNVIFSYCRSLWPEHRDIRFSFAGLITKSREEFLQKFAQSNPSDFKLNLKYFAFLNFLSKLKSKIQRNLKMQGAPRATRFKQGDIVFWASERGRSFPIKSWDDDYFELLANSKFVLCPSGDYTWTYRFFEAVMCGAIPVIEDYSPVYNGFRFKTINEPVRTMEWSQDDAEYNYNLCQLRLRMLTKISCVTLAFQNA